MFEWLTSSIVAAAMTLCGIALTVTGVKMKRGSLKPNSLAGVRIPSAYRSEEDWYRIQAKCAHPAIAVGVICFDSAALFVVQAIFPSAIPIMVPVSIMSIQLILGYCYMLYVVLNVNNR
ncbi:SdpI family protein [Actinomyces procaprae]|uniref:SdpI family protein n=1 Tax=Actinomyces procaprae TaxID=2560010 RepID=UPI00109DCE3E|nr:SdpI family protein [Actinomyces procaprae]